MDINNNGSRFFCSFLLFVNLYSGEIAQPVKNLEQYASVLNIEGGRVERGLSQNQHWANIAIVLDTPFSTLENRITYNDLNAKLERDKEFNYTLKEMYIPSFNEYHYHLSTLLALDYILNKCDRVLIYIHRGVSAKSHMEKLFLGLNELYPDGYRQDSELRFHHSDKVVSFKHGYDIGVLENAELYKGYDCIFSVSILCALDSYMESGQVIVPNQFRKAFLGGEFIKVDSAIYNAKNFINEHFDDIYNEKNISQISQKLRKIPFSDNKDKNPLMNLVPLDPCSFLRNVVLLEVDGLFSPETSAPEFILL